MKDGRETKAGRELASLVTGQDFPKSARPGGVSKRGTWMEGRAPIVGDPIEEEALTSKFTRHVFCGAETRSIFFCTRPPRHSKDHVAVKGERIVARWGRGPIAGIHEPRFRFQTEAEALYFAESLRDVGRFEDVISGFSIEAPNGFVFAPVVALSGAKHYDVIVRFVEDEETSS
jgi:hypothetical protein